MHMNQFLRFLFVPLLALAAIALAGAARPGGGIIERPIPTRDSLPGDIAVGLDGTIYFTETGADTIGRISPNGTLTEQRVPSGSTRAYLQTIATAASPRASTSPGSSLHASRSG
jgi:streptogramin lyase